MNENIRYYILPVTDDARQVFTLDMTIDGAVFQARIEIRFLYGPWVWVISIWNNATGELMVNQIPLVCSYGEINDLLAPFRHLRDGAGMRSLFVLKNTDQPGSVDPDRYTLTNFNVLFGDTFG